MKNIKPFIGITLDSSIPEVSGRHAGYSQYPWYALREKYPAAITQAGGIPLMLSHEENLIEDYLSVINGLVLTGGRVDINPSLYGVMQHHPSLTLNEKRTHFELLLLKKALNKNIPILGICGGHQLINVAFGGTLIQHIPDENSSFLEHRQEEAPLHTFSHSVKVLPHTLLSTLVGSSSFSVNSAHHQAIKDLGGNLTPSALSSDGIIEAVESTHHPFVMGIQWHPEFFLSPESFKIFTAFIKASQQTFSK